MVCVEERALRVDPEPVVLADQTTCQVHVLEVAETELLVDLGVERFDERSDEVVPRFDVGVQNQHEVRPRARDSLVDPAAEAGVLGRW